MKRFKVGMRVVSNLDGRIEGAFYTGVIHSINTHFTNIKRDDGAFGMGENRTWFITNSAINKSNTKRFSRNAAKLLKVVK